MYNRSQRVHDQLFTGHVRTNLSTMTNIYEINSVKVGLGFSFVCNPDLKGDKKLFGALVSIEKQHTVDVSAISSAIFDCEDEVSCCHVSVMYCSKEGFVWNSHSVLHEVIVEAETHQYHDLTKMNRLEGQNLDTIRPVLASGAVFVFIFTFQFYRYRKFSNLIIGDSCSCHRALVVVINIPEYLNIFVKVLVSRGRSLVAALIS